VLFSGLMVELGLFAILRITTAIFGSTFAGIPDPLKVCFLALGGLTAVWGGIMSFAEHHLKRVLAFSTISHSGMMLFAMGLGSRMAVAGWLVYLCAHAVIKSGLFFTAGVLLHRLRTMSEPILFAKGKQLKFTAAVWFLGACGLAGLPPYALAVGEDMVSHAAHGTPEVASTVLFLISGMLTAGAVLRVFMRVFCGWGDHGPSDRSSQIDELPESHEENKVIPFRKFAPAALCALSGIALTFLPKLNLLSFEAARRFLSQHEYIAAIYAVHINGSSTVPEPSDVTSMILHGAASIVCALILAAWAVFHQHIPRAMRWASHLEGRMGWARQIQSGQPADYVTWIMVGTAALGSVFFLMR
jgi:multicomponent Na+:H+ antiporter subunit D